MSETRVWFLGGEDPLEKEITTHFGILAWRIPWTDEPGRLWSIGLQRVWNDLSCTHTHTRAWHWTSTPNLSYNMVFKFQIHLVKPHHLSQFCSAPGRQMWVGLSPGVNCRLLTLCHGLQWVWGLESLYRHGHRLGPCVVFSSPLWMGIGCLWELGMTWKKMHVEPWPVTAEMFSY